MIAEKFETFGTGFIKSINRNVFPAQEKARREPAPFLLIAVRF